MDKEEEEIQEQEEQEEQQEEEIKENIFSIINNKENDKSKRFILITDELKKQYESTLNSGGSGSNDDIKNLDWIVNIVRQAFQSQQLKEDKKKLLQWFFKNLIIQVSTLRSKYYLINETTSTTTIDEKQRLRNKIWEYQIQIILRLEYLNLKKDIFTNNSSSGGENDNNNSNSIDNLVSLLQDVSFLLDSTAATTTNTQTTTEPTTTSSTIITVNNNNKGCIEFLEKIILKRYIQSLKKELIQIYTNLEISKPKELKKENKNKLSYQDKILKELNNVNNNSNSSSGNTEDGDNKKKNNEDIIESTLNINLDEIEDCNNINYNLRKKRKQIEKEKQEKEKEKLLEQQQQTKVPKDLFKKVNIKKVNHFTLALSNPEKSFKMFNPKN